jgi:Calcineurin-like phosphoesterase
MDPFLYFIFLPLITCFVVYLGDVITANNIAIQNATLYWDKAISPTRKRGIPWASIFGNHDDAYFEWPSDWFSASGIPQVNCPTSSNSYSSRHSYQYKS